MTTPIWVNGERSDGRISITDSSVLRGDGCFEVLKAYAGTVFAIDDHLDRLRKSAGALEIELPSDAHLSSWINRAAEECGDCAVRVVVTRGSALPEETSEPLVIVFAHPWEIRDQPARLYPVVAPWHAAGVPWALAGAKLLSYAPNLSATREAQAAGFDDALLLTATDEILEGPTFSVAWVIDERLETPGLDLGILGSITRKVVLEDAEELGISVVEGHWGLERVARASEVMALSTIREVQPVSAIGDWTFSEGPVTTRLAEAFAQRIG